MSFRPYSLRVWFALALAFTLAGAVQAGTTGKIAGTVRDGGSGLPLPAANVTLIGTSMGAASNEGGEYFILNVPAGTYSIQATVIGYKPLLMSNVLVTPDFTTDLDFALEPSVALTVETVEVASERPLIQRDATSTVRVVDAAEYEKLPTRGYQDAVSLQSGVVGSLGSTSAEIQGQETTNSAQLFVRGGRANQVAYFVDGFSQQDPLTGYSTTAISTNAVEQVVVLTGGFNAEYGRIMSGAVNVVTKEGSDEYFGTLDILTDNLGGDWLGTTAYDYNVYDFSLGGPLIPGNDDIDFFVSGERRWYGDRSPRSFDTDLVPEGVSEELADGLLPNNHLSGYTWQGKLNYQLSPKTTLKFGTLGSSDDWQEYLHTYAFALDHTPRYEDRNLSFFGTVTQTLGTNTFGEFKLNYFETTRKRGDGVHFDDLDGYVRYDSTGAAIGNPRFDEDLSMFWLGDDPATSEDESHFFDDYLERRSNYLGFEANATHKWNDENTAKFGGDFQRHTLRYYNNLFPTNEDALDVVNYGFDQRGNETDDPTPGFDDGPKNPIVGSFYVQNKYEADDFVVNAGLRYDRLDPKTPALVNADTPFGPREGDASLDPEDLTDSSAQDKVSPRLGIAFPISEDTQFFANYGKFYQQPNLQDLYTSYRYLEHKINLSGYYFPFGNPNLVPEETTAYEVGIQRALNPDVRLDLTAYYKDVKDLVQVENIPSIPANFASFRNSDYGTIKGVDMSISMRELNGISGSLNYSLSYAKGTGSTAQSQRDIAWQAEEAPRTTAPLAFDQRHKLSLNLDFSSGEEGGPMLGGMFPLENSGLNLLLRAASGFPYTPVFPANVITLGSISEQVAGPINSVYGPWTYSVDAKATRQLPLGLGFDVEAYVWVLNLFDTRNDIDVYQTTGDAATTGWLATEEGRNWAEANGPEAAALYQFAENDPTNFGIPRQVRFGLKMNF